MLNKEGAIQRFFQSLIITLIVIIFSGCSSIPNPYHYGDVEHGVKPIIAQHEINNKNLLDVSIKMFDPGKLPEDEDDRRGLSEEIRKAEARYMPIHLKYTMQRTGYWGNVRVVPGENEGSEIQIEGKILESNGEEIKVAIRVSDATNKLWFEKEYSQSVTLEQRGHTEPEKRDSFQDIYNKISNDIIEYRRKLTSSEVSRIKQVAQLRFAKYMAPATFSNYLKKDRDGIYQLVRLPSEDDPMIKRVEAVKARDNLLQDTINNYYDIYYSDMWESYDNWRKFRSEEMATIREIDRKALTQKVIGAAAIIGAIALGASSNQDVRDRSGTLRSIMIAGGGYALYQGFQTSKETEINKESIEELGASFSSEVEPMVIDIEGKTTKLTGSAEQQYAQWKQLLRKIYQQETGFDN